MPYLSQQFWQQSLPQSGLPLWYVQRKVSIGCSLICGLLHLLVGVLVLVMMQKSVEISIPYDYSHHGTVQDITIPATMAGPIFLHAELSGIYTNYRTFTSSKDNAIAGASASAFECDGGETMQDLVHIRGIDFIQDPPEKYVNSEGFFNTANPIRDVTQGIDKLDTTTIRMGDVLRYRDSAADKWTVVEVSETSPTIEEVKALTSGFIQGNSTMPRPCGLNSYSMFLDHFEITKDAVPITLDESDLAWDTDVTFIESTKDGVITGLHFSDDAVDMNREIHMGDPNDPPLMLSWLKGTIEVDGAKFKDAPFHHMLAWYRNFVSTTFRVVLGKYDVDAVPAGDYKLKFSYVENSWDHWGVERKLIISSLSSMGSNNMFIPLVCFAMGGIQLLFAIYFMLNKRKLE